MKLVLLGSLDRDASLFWDSFEGGTTHGLEIEYKYHVIAFYVESILPQSLVLDLGCGFGRMNQFYNIGRYYGVDTSPRMIGEARALNKNKSNAKFFLVNGHSLKLFEDEMFDVVICSTVILHLKVKTVKIYAQEVWRILKGNGFFLANFPKKCNLDISKVFASFDIKKIDNHYRGTDNVFIFRKKVSQ